VAGQASSTTASTYTNMAPAMLNQAQTIMEELASKRPDLERRPIQFWV